MRDNADLIRKSRELAQIKTDIDIELDLGQLEARPPDRVAAYELFRELEFANLTSEFADAAATPARVSGERKYSVIGNRSELDRLAADLWQAESIGLAISNSTPAGAGQQQSTRDDHGAHGFAFSQAEGKSAFLDLETFAGGKEAALGALRELFANGLLKNRFMT